MGKASRTAPSQQPGPTRERYLRFRDRRKILRDRLISTMKEAYRGSRVYSEVTTTPQGTATTRRFETHWDPALYAEMEEVATLLRVDLQAAIADSLQLLSRGWNAKKEAKGGE